MKETSLGENHTLLGYYAAGSGNVSLLLFFVCARYYYLLDGDDTQHRGYEFPITDRSTVPTLIRLYRCMRQGKENTMQKNSHYS